MRSLVACILIAALASCDAASTGEPAAPEGTAPATETAAIPDTIPQPPAATSVTSGGEADDNQCGADKLARWLNVLPTDDVKAEILETVGERPIRYYSQGDPITMDFS